MKKVLLSLIAVIIGIVISSNVLQSHSFTPPTGQSCNSSGCHNAGGAAVPCTYYVDISSSMLGAQIPSSPQIFDPQYGITDTLTFIISIPSANTAGFQMSCNQGSFIITNPTNTAIVHSGGISYISHLNATFGAVSWTFKWVPTNITNSNNINFNYSIVCDTSSVIGTGIGSCAPGCSGTSTGSFNVTYFDCSCADCVGNPVPFLKSANRIGASNYQICYGDTVGFYWHSAGVINNPTGNGLYNDWSGTTFSNIGLGTLWNGNDLVINDTNWTSVVVNYQMQYNCSSISLVYPTIFHDTITVNKPPVIPTLPKLVNCNHNSIILGSTNVISNNKPLVFIWSPATYLNNAVIDTPTANPYHTTTYYVEVTDFVGCRAVASQKVGISQTIRKTYNITRCINNPYFFQNQFLSVSGTYIDTLTRYVGCDSIVTINLTIKPISTSSISATICSNQFYYFNQQNINVSGVYYDTLVTYLNCDSIITLNLNVKPISNKIITQNQCAGIGGYYFKGNLLTQSGTYYDTLLNYQSCDSFITLNLFIHPIYHDTIVRHICANNSYYFNSKNLSIAGFYNDTLQSIYGCDSFVTLHLDVITNSNYFIPKTICSNQSYYFHNQFLTTSGTYYDTLINQYGCDSFVTLSFTILPISSISIFDTTCNNQPVYFNQKLRYISGIYHDTLSNYLGCDSFITYHLFVKQTNSSSLNISICSNDFYTFNHHNLNVAGHYIDTFTNQSGCDSTVNLFLTIKSLSYKSINQNICAGSSYYFSGNALTTSGIYYDTTLNYKGCDSVTTLFLSVLHHSQFAFTKTICNNQFYNFNGTLLNTTGIYYDTIYNYLGCDSVLILTLRVLPTSTNSITKTICSNQPVYIHNQYVNTSGIYHDTLINFLGCDSFLTLNLIVKQAKQTIINKLICSNNPYYFNGHFLNIANTYYDTFVNYQGCDSLIILHLAVNQSSQINTTTIKMCEGNVYHHNGINYTNSTIIYDSLLSVYGCDSILSITLNMIKSADTTVLQQNNLFIATAQKSSYQWYDCDAKQIIFGATNDTFMATHTGNYSVIVKDSLTYCSDTSSCRSVIVANSDDYLSIENKINIYPNPCVDWVIISSITPINTIEVINIIGGKEAIEIEKISANEYKLKTDKLTAGTYFIKATNINWKLINETFIKE